MSRRASALALAGWLLAFSPSALAAPQGGQAIPEARQAQELGTRGLSEFDAGRFQSAYNLFQSAEGLAHSPVFVLYEARCLARLKDPLGSREHYLTLLQAPLTPSAPEPWLRAQEAARSELAQLEAGLARARIVVGPEWTAPVQLEDTGDGQAAAHRYLLFGPEAVVWMEPGRHRLLARTSQGALTRAIELELQPGEEKLVELHAGPASWATAAMHVGPKQGATEPAPDPQPMPPAPRANAGPAGWALLASGGVLLLGGAAFGLLAIDDASRLYAQCGPSGCPQRARSLETEARRWGNLSTLAFGVGAVAVGAGAGVLLLGPGSVTIQGRLP